MRTAHAKPCQRTADELPTGGFTLSKFGARDRVLVAGGGRPELEIYTPVNIGNGPYRDNGEGVAATPLPYPTSGRSDSRISLIQSRLRLEARV